MEHHLIDEGDPNANEYFHEMEEATAVLNKAKTSSDIVRYINNYKKEKMKGKEPMLIALQEKI
ncbi:hypothetical protein C5167_019530 [Papaver somniferum]|uniref:Uncharacterized protein n=1 Tax=Papaver somniferum TaxID=3469 RepID=A0A4Y7ITI1_PAPSO|nr:hypothetical protein C5167_019530 [Papaver somniferum]